MLVTVGLLNGSRLLLNEPQFTRNDRLKQPCREAVEYPEFILLCRLLPELIDLRLRNERRQMDPVSTGGVQTRRRTLGDEVRDQPANAGRSGIVSVPSFTRIARFRPSSPSILPHNPL